MLNEDRKWKMNLDDFDQRWIWWARKINVRHASKEEEEIHADETKKVFVQPFTFCPPVELNEPVGVPFGSRHPF